MAELTIDQTSGKAIVNWSGFSIGQGGTVTFNNGSGATLNRVTGSATQSAIAGNLNATGSVYLINPNGVIVGKTGVVKVGGNFVASTLRTRPTHSSMRADRSRSRATARPLSSITARSARSAVT